MSADERIEALTAEVASLRIKIEAPDTTIWYKKPATLISIAALAFSLGTTGFAAYNSHQEDIRANRRDVRAVLQRLSKLPIENYELLQITIREWKNRLAFVEFSYFPADASNLLGYSENKPELLSVLES